MSTVAGQPSGHAASPEPVFQLLPAMRLEPYARLGGARRFCPVRLIGLVRTWHERHRSHRALVELPDHLLEDIGLSRVELLVWRRRR